MAQETTPTPENQQPEEANAEAKAVPEAKEANAEAKATSEEGKEAKAAKAKPADGAEKPAAAKAAKKPKEPAIEDKPFTEFIEKDFTPALQEALTKQGLEDVELKFVKQALPMAGVNSGEQCWQLTGNLLNGKRQFNLYFLNEDINGKKAFSYATNGTKPSTIESFMIDERKVTMDLLLLYTLQRLNGQKWLTRN
jgi:Protein of unknown function (DUF2996)